MLKKYKEIWIPFSIFLFIMALLLMNKILPIDLWIYHQISYLICNPITSIMKTITFFGNTNTIFYLSIIWLIYLSLKKKKEIIPFLITLFISILCILYLKPIFARPRPDILRLIPIDGYSFPSGHSIISAAFYGYLITYLLENKKPKYLAFFIFLIFIFGIGFSRIYLGVHYFSDVLAGYSVGFLALGIGNLLRRKDKVLWFI